MRGRRAAARPARAGALPADLWSRLRDRRRGGRSGPDPLPSRERARVRGRKRSVRRRGQRGQARPLVETQGSPPRRALRLPLPLAGEGGGEGARAAARPARAGETFGAGDDGKPVQGQGQGQGAAPQAAIHGRRASPRVETQGSPPRRRQIPPPGADRRVHRRLRQSRAEADRRAGRRAARRPTGIRCSANRRSHWNSASHLRNPPHPNPLPPGERGSEGAAAPGIPPPPLSPLGEKARVRGLAGRLSSPPKKRPIRTTLATARGRTPPQRSGGAAAPRARPTASSSGRRRPRSPRRGP